MFDLYSFLIYIFVTAYTPGPNNIMSMSNAIRFGFRNSFPFNLGIFAGFSVVMVMCTLFSATLFRYISEMKTYMLTVGAAYMLYLAWKTWTATANIEAHRSGNVSSPTAGASFVSGMLLQFVNAKIYIYAITSMSVYILPFFSDRVTLLEFAILLAFVGFTGTVAWSLFGAVFCRILSKYPKPVNAIMALLLVYCAVSLFI